MKRDPYSWVIQEGLLGELSFGDGYWLLLALLFPKQWLVSFPWLPWEAVLEMCTPTETGLGKDTSVPCQASLLQKCDIPGPGGQAGMDPWRTQVRRRHWAAHSLLTAGILRGA